MSNALSTGYVLTSEYLIQDDGSESLVWCTAVCQSKDQSLALQPFKMLFYIVNGDRKSYTGVQCKGKDANFGSKATLSEIEAEIAKADTFTPALEHWVFATTAPVDGKLQEAARKLSIQRKKDGLFGTDVLGWYEIQALMAEHPEVIGDFYPEHADHLPEIVEALQALPSIDAKLASLLDHPNARTHLAPKHPTVGKWEVISFEADRGLGPALLGRPMGPSDAAACPRLLEADMLASQLKIAFSARLRGEPGVGKSICSYQVARDYAAEGYEVLRLTDPQAETIDSPEPTIAKRLLLVDNAHLMTPGNLPRLEEYSGPDQLVLSVHTAIDQSDFERGSVTLNAKRAVHTIASAFRTDLPRTLSYVRVADDRVGERMMDVDLSSRIDHAEKTADRPWQFCFILGGGWRRSRQAADAAQNAGAAFVLAAVAIRQLASRDAIALPKDIVPICKTGTASDSGTEYIDTALSLPPPSIFLGKRISPDPFKQSMTKVLESLPVFRGSYLLCTKSHRGEFSALP